jgi:hypothetical protein
MDTTTLLIIILIILLVGGGGFYGRGRWCRQEKAPARTGALAMLWFHVARDLPAIGG